MMKDTFFSFSRFVNVCRKDVAENWKTYMLRLAMWYGVLAVVLVWNGFYVYRYGWQDINFGPFVFMFGLWGFGLLGASYTMEKMKSKTGRLSTLMLPATPFEKFFSRWFVFTVVFLVAYLFAFRMADCTKALIYSAIYPENASVGVTPLARLFEGDVYNRKNPEFQGVLIAAYFFFQSCFVLGSSIWPKNSFIKTVAASVVIFVSYFLIVGFVVKYVVSGHLSAFSDISQETVINILYVVVTTFTLLNWVLAYYRFKESEIINRM